MCTFLKKTGKPMSTTVPSRTPSVLLFSSAMASGVLNAAGIDLCYRLTIRARCWSFITNGITKIGERTRSITSSHCATSTMTRPTAKLSAMKPRIKKIDPILRKYAFVS